MTVLRTSLRNFAAHKGRMVLSAVAVALSVAFVCGTLIFTDTINATFEKMFTTQAADVTVGPPNSADPQSTGKPETVPVSLLNKIEGIEGVERAYIDVYSDGITAVNDKKESIGTTTGAPTIGASWQDTDRSPVKLTSGHEPRNSQEAIVDKDTALEKDIQIGDTLTILAVPGNWKVKVTGIATFTTVNPGAALVYFDTVTAQNQLLGSTALTSEIDIDAKPGVDHDDLKKAALAALGNKYEVKTQAEAATESNQNVGSMLGVMKSALLGFAGVSVLVGTFLIVNTFSMLVANRTRELGLMRAVGASRKQVNRTVLVEALILGGVGSLAGIVAGIALTHLLLDVLAWFGVQLGMAEVVISWTSPLAGLTLGVVTTVIAAYLPARRASKVSPMAALRDHGLPGRSRAGRVRACVGGLFTFAGIMALLSAGQSDEILPGASSLAVGVVLTLVGFIMLSPMLAGYMIRGISSVVLRRSGHVGQMAERNALRNPRRTGATAAALMIGLALVAGLSVVASSLVASSAAELDRTIGADFIIDSPKGLAVSPAAEQAVKGSEGVAHVTDAKGVKVLLTAPDGYSATKKLSAADPTFAQDLRARTVEGRFDDAFGRNSMSVSARFAEDHMVKLGDQMYVTFLGGSSARLKVKAITADNTTLNPDGMYISIDTVRAHLPGKKLPLDNSMFVKAEEGQEEATYAALKSTLSGYPQYSVRDQAAYKQSVQDRVERWLNMVYGALALAIIVAVLGVVNTLALSVVERTREIGLMRAIGMTRKQLRRMIRLESIVIALFGAIMGLALGMIWGVSAQQLMTIRGMGVLQISWPTIATVFLGAALVGVIAALFPAFRATRLNVLQAIHTE